MTSKQKISDIISAIINSALEGSVYVVFQTQTPEEFQIARQLSSKISTSISAKISDTNDPFNVALFVNAISPDIGDGYFVNLVTEQDLAQMVISKNLKNSIVIDLRIKKPFWQKVFRFLGFFSGKVFNYDFKSTNK